MINFQKDAGGGVPLILLIKRNIKKLLSELINYFQQVYFYSLYGVLLSRLYYGQFCYQPIPVRCISTNPHFHRFIHCKQDPTVQAHKSYINKTYHSARGLHR